MPKGIYDRETVRQDSRPAAREVEPRKERMSLNAPRKKLFHADIPGYHTRWINDVGGRLEFAQQCDYEFVYHDELKKIGDGDVSNINRDLGSRVSFIVNQSIGTKAYLMKIKSEFKREIDDDALAKIEAVDRQIKKGKLHDIQHSYVPNKGRGIDIEESTKH